jgi:hypothetical protein
MECDELGTLSVFSSEILTLILSFIDRRHYPILRMVCRKLADMFRFDVLYYSPSNAKSHYNECFDYLLETHQCDLAIWLWDNMRVDLWVTGNNMEHVYESRNKTFIEHAHNNFEPLNDAEQVQVRRGRYLSAHDAYDNISRRQFLHILYGAAENRNYDILHHNLTHCFANYIIDAGGIQFEHILLLAMLCARDCIQLATICTGGRKFHLTSEKRKYVHRVLVSCGDMRILNQSMQWLSSNTHMLLAFDTECIDWLTFTQILKHAKKSYAKSISGSVLRVAAGTGNIEVMMYVIQNTEGGSSQIKDDRILTLAVKNNHKHAIEWLVKNISLSKVQLQYGLREAIRYNKRDLIDWMLSDEYCNISLGPIYTIIPTVDHLPPDSVIIRLQQDNSEHAVDWLLFDLPELCEWFCNKSKPISDALVGMIFLWCAQRALPKCMLWLIRRVKSDNATLKIDTSCIQLLLPDSKNGEPSVEYNKRVIQVFEILHEHGYPIHHCLHEYMNISRSKYGARDVFRDMTHVRGPNLIRYIKDHAALELVKK